MMIVVRLILNAAVLMGVAYLVPGVSVDSFPVALGAALVFGLVNILIKPLVHLVSLPITIVTLGLFGLIINGLLFWLVAALLEGFDVSGFFAALIGALAMSIGNGLISRLAKRV